MRHVVDDFQLGERAMRYSLFVPRLYNYCLSLGFKRALMMPSRAFCSDESQGYPVILTSSSFRPVTSATIQPARNLASIKDSAPRSAASATIAASFALSCTGIKRNMTTPAEISSSARGVDRRPFQLPEGFGLRQARSNGKRQACGATSWWTVFGPHDS
jgi:hypothetical protein